MKKTTKRYKEILKRRQSVICCNKKKELADRAKYGVSRCDAYSFNCSVGKILANALFQYVADAEERIVRDDFELILKHAQAIKDYVEVNSMDIASDDLTERCNFLEKERDFRYAMFWLTENWKGLWW